MKAKAIRDLLDEAKQTGRNVYVEILIEGNLFSYRVLNARTREGATEVQTLTTWRKLLGNEQFDIR